MAAAAAAAQMKLADFRAWGIGLPRARKTWCPGVQVAPLHLKRNIIMTKKELQAILKYVTSGEDVKIKVRGANGIYVHLDIENVEVHSDAIALQCYNKDIHFGNDK